MVVRLLLTLLITIAWTHVWAASIEAHVDRNPVTVNESFQLIFDVDGELDQEPDFSPLEALFDILNSSYSNRVEIGAGGTQRSRQWQLTLMAREAGSYTIPAIAFGKDSSSPLALTVKEEPVSTSTQDSPIFMEAELTPGKAYVQSQLVYTVRLLRSVHLRSGKLTEPKLSGPDAIVEKLGDDRSYETSRNGVRYVVVERSYAIFPQQDGTLTLEPTVFTGQIVQGNRRSFNETLKTRRLQTEAFTVDVKPIPANARRPWLPATQLRLSEQWAEEPLRFRVGEPVTRTITLMASGIAAAQLPQLSRSLPDGLKRYPDQPLLKDQIQDNGLLGIRQEKVAIMPSREGKFELPAIEIPWWNVETGQQELARIPARSIEVVAGSGAQSAPPPSPADTDPLVAATAKPEIVERVSAGFWPWLSLALALAWASTALVWWRQGRSAKPASPRQQTGNSLRQLKQACRCNDAHACKSALLQWARSQWPDNPPTSLGAIAARVDPPFAEALNRLNRSLYAAERGSCNGEELVDAAQQWLKSNKTTRGQPPSPIAPLHPERQPTP